MTGAGGARHGDARPTTAATLAVLGATGSVGTQALDVVRRADGRFRVQVLGAHSSADALVDQAREFEPEVVVLVDPDAATDDVRRRLPAGTELWVGPDALSTAAARSDVVLNAVVGFAGLGVTMAALGAGHRLALANKESLVAGGPVVRAVLPTPGAELVPVDSEHSALHQCLRSGRGNEVRRLLLTASGGPFRGRRADELAGVTVEQALAHPTWSMGPKITVDSSTLMNKGLEVIEAKELFDLDVDRIDVVVHPQSIVHSMVEFTDGSTIAQLSRPDMRLPIAYALGYPERVEEDYGSLDWATASTLTFEPPDRATFRCLDLAYEASRVGGTAPAWLNGANEEVVAAFLAGRIAWNAIAAILEGVMARHDGGKAATVADVVEADAAARRCAVELLNGEARAPMT